MKPPFFATAVRLADENRRLKDDCERLLTALHLANDSTDKARAELRRVAHERDEALGIVVGLRTDIAGYERINAALMEHAPTTIEELDHG